MRVLFCVFVISLLLTACGGGTGSAGSTIDPEANRTTYRACTDAVRMTIPPIDLNEVVGITPLGDTQPPDFTLPRVDMLWYTGDPQNPPLIASTVVTPGSLRVFAVEEVSYSNSSRPYSTDYSVYFYLCDQINGYIHHVGALDAGFAALVGGFSGATCSTETRTTETLTRCRKTVSIDLALGIALGVMPTTAHVRFGVNDNRFTNSFINVSRYTDRRYNTCPLDHFEPAAVAAIYTRVGLSDGSQLRTASPACGDFTQDLINTAKGNWVLSAYNAALPLEAQSLALIEDPIEPNDPLFSIGDIGSTLDRRKISFLIAESGTVNRAFSAVTADGSIYCYDLNGEPILLQLMDAHTLRFEAVMGAACGGISQVFSANMKTFIR